MRQWNPIKEYEDILFEEFEGIAKITINRPQVYNAFRPETNKEMIDAMAICRAHHSLVSLNNRRHSCTLFIYLVYYLCLGDDLNVFKIKYWSIIYWSNEVES